MRNSKKARWAHMIAPMIALIVGLFINGTAQAGSWDEVENGDAYASFKQQRKACPKLICPDADTLELLMLEVENVDGACDTSYGKNAAGCKQDVVGRWRNAKVKSDQPADGGKGDPPAADPPAADPPPPTHVASSDDPPYKNGHKCDNDGECLSDYCNSDTGNCSRKPRRRNPGNTLLANGRSCTDGAQCTGTFCCDGFCSSSKCKKPPTLLADGQDCNDGKDCAGTFCCDDGKCSSSECEIAVACSNGVCESDGASDGAVAMTDADGKVSYQCMHGVDEATGKCKADNGLPSWLISLVLGMFAAMLLLILAVLIKWYFDRKRNRRYDFDHCPTMWMKFRNAAFLDGDALGITDRKDIPKAIRDTRATISKVKTDLSEKRRAEKEANKAADNALAKEKSAKNEAARNAKSAREAKEKELKAAKDRLQKLKNLSSTWREVDSIKRAFDRACKALKFKAKIDEQVNPDHLAETFPSEPDPNPTHETHPVERHEKPVRKDPADKEEDPFDGF